LRDGKDEQLAQSAMRGRGKIRHVEKRYHFIGILAVIQLAARGKRAQAQERGESIDFLP